MAVRVSLVCFSGPDGELAPERRLDGETVDEIHTDLTARRGGTGVDMTKARRLARNKGVAFMGDTKGGPFDVPGDLAREWLREPANPNGRPNSDVLKPWMNGMAVTRRPADKWIVDFGWTMVREDTWPVTACSTAYLRGEFFLPTAAWSLPPPSVLPTSKSPTSGWSTEVVSVRRDTLVGLAAALRDGEQYSSRSRAGTQAR